MIKEAYCSFEVSKLLKEKGFDAPPYSLLVDRNKVNEINLDPPSGKLFWMDFAAKEK